MGMMQMMQGMGAGGPVMEKVMRMVMQMSNPLMGMMKEVMEIIPGPGNKNAHRYRHGCQMAIAGFLDCVLGPSGMYISVDVHWSFGLLDYGSATLHCKI